MSYPTIGYPQVQAYDPRRTTYDLNNELSPKHLELWRQCLEAAPGGCRERAAVSRQRRAELMARGLWFAEGLGLRVGGQGVSRLAFCVRRTTRPRP